MPHPLLLLLLACAGSGAPTAAPAPAPAPAPAAAPASAEPSARLHDVPASLRADTVDVAALRADPVHLRLVPSVSYDDTDVVLSWLEANPAVYDYLPPAVQSRPAVAARALALGYAPGVRVTRAVTARTAPRADAPVARYASDTTNGYLAEARAEQRFDGERLAVLSDREVGGERWLQVTAAQASSPEAEREAFEMVTNVGGIARADFSLAVDPGWIPASATAPDVLARRCDAGVKTLQSIENGDLAIYAAFDGVSFDSFSEANTALLQAVDAGRLAPGDAVYLVWCDGEIVWWPPQLSAP